MTVSLLLSLMACIGMLFLGLLVLFRGGPSAFARTIGVLALDMFAWNFFAMAYAHTGQPQWDYLDGAFSPFTPPLVFQAVVLLVGSWRRLRWLLYVAYLCFAILSLNNIVHLLDPSWRFLSNTQVWSYLFFGFWIPLMVVEIALLLRHVRRSPSPEEQMRGRLTLASVLIGSLLGITESWDHLLQIPSLGHLGTLLSMSIITVVLFRLRLAGRELTASVVAYSLALAILGIAGYLVVFRWSGINTAQIVLGTGCVTIMLLLAFRGVSRTLHDRRARTRELAALGRFSAQMAHDLKNPLAALKGALQVVQADDPAPGGIAGEMLPLMEQQITRMEEVVSRYQRMSRVEVHPEPLDLEALFERARSLAVMLATQQNQELQVTVEAADGLHPVSGDAALLSAALENLVRNAVDAMREEPGELRLLVGDDPAGGGATVLSVEDNGPGMDPRLLERVTDDFYSTKADGSGLGLAFTRRVLEAHGGQLRLSSHPGKGTRAQLVLPHRLPIR